jgi:hypothetical protein
VDIATVDPRDARWETDVRAYRVYFWTRDTGHCEEFEVSGTPDIRAVVAWAEEEAHGRVVEVFACLTCDGEPGLARLTGGRPKPVGAYLRLS